MNRGKRKQIGSGRGSPRARARIALSCAALLGRRRRGESLLRHRMSGWALRMPARSMVADVTRSARIGRQRSELFHQPDNRCVPERMSVRGRSRLNSPAVDESDAAWSKMARFVERVQRIPRVESAAWGGFASPPSVRWRLGNARSSRVSAVFRATGSHSASRAPTVWDIPSMNGEHRRPSLPRAQMRQNFTQSRNSTDAVYCGSMLLLEGPEEERPLHEATSRSLGDKLMTRSHGQPQPDPGPPTPPRPDPIPPTPPRPDPGPPTPPRPDPIPPTPPRPDPGPPTPPRPDPVPSTPPRANLGPHAD